jgi:hypothetical protein
MYRQQEEEHTGMQQQHHFAERQPEQLQYYTPPTMAPPRSPSPFLPHHHHSSSFPGFGVPALPPRLPLGPVKTEPGQPSSSSNRILSFGGAGQTPSTLNFSSGGDWPEAGVEAVQQMPPERRSRTHWNTQEHVIAERKRREKMQQQFVALATIVPDLTKVMHIDLVLVWSFSNPNRLCSEWILLLCAFMLYYLELE